MTTGITARRASSSPSASSFAPGAAPPAATPSVLAFLLSWKNSAALCPLIDVCVSSRIAQRTKAS